jgi:hypothetical protein
LLYTRKLRGPFVTFVCPKRVTLSNRYSYVYNNPLNLVDPNGHAGIRPNLIDIGGKDYDGQWRGVGRIPVSDSATTNTARQVTSLAVDFTPVIGDAKGLVEVFTGKDLITGEDLGHWRWLGLCGLVGLAEIRYLRYADEVMELGVPIGRVLRNGKWVEFGSWVRRQVSMSDAARAYQQFVTGAESGFEFLRNGIHFDGARLTDTGEMILLDAKHAPAGAGSFYSKVGTEGWARQQVLTEAQNQLKAADGLTVQWHVSDWICSQERV